MKFIKKSQFALHYPRCLALLVAFMAAWPVLAQENASVRKTVDPETCFLETVGNMRLIDNPRLIRYNCSIRYIRMVEVGAREVDPANASGANLSVNSQSYELMGNALEMKFKNDSNFTIISAYIYIKTEANPKGNVFKLQATTPVGPFSVGTLITSAPDDLKGYSWGLVKLLGIKN